MPSFHLLEAHREKRLNAKVSDTASMVASELRDALTEGATGPFHIEIGEKPRKIYPAEYLEKVQNRTIEALGRVGLGEAVTYDPDASLQASTEMEAINDTSYSNWVNRVKEDLTIVFRGNVILH